MEFTDSQIYLLYDNPNLLVVGRTYILYSEEFVKIFREAYFQGKSSKEIFTEAGFDIQLLGEQHITFCTERWSVLKSVKKIPKNIRTVEKSAEYSPKVRIFKDTTNPSKSFKFSKESKTTIVSIQQFYENTCYLYSFGDFKWHDDIRPSPNGTYYKVTGNLLMRIGFGSSLTNFGMDEKEKLDFIEVALRDGKTEYEVLDHELEELIEERKQHKTSKKLDAKIKEVKSVQRRLKRILPPFTKPFSFNEGEKDVSESIFNSKRSPVDTEFAKKYVVLDLETNGLRTANDDLLSITIYDPYSGKLYNRYLPLELQPTVLNAFIHGINDDKIAHEPPLSQKEMDGLIKEFDLKNKVILSYSGGDFDVKFLKNYCKRHKLIGFDSLTFENIKRKIISSSYGNGNISKDNLCNVLGISGVSETHTGENDCYLEWQLYESIFSRGLFIKNNQIYEFSKDYIVPSSFLTSFPRLAELANLSIPQLTYSNELIYEFSLPKKLVSGVQKFSTNISGVAVEHLINTMVGAVECDNSSFLISNNSKLKYVGQLESLIEEIPVLAKNDGTMQAIIPEQEDFVSRVNEVTNIIRGGIQDVVVFIRTKIFKNSPIKTQELVFSENNRVLALCDLSNEKSVLEIKTFDIFEDSRKDSIIRQMYYQQNGREMFALSIVYDSSYVEKRQGFVEVFKGLYFKIYKVEISKIEDSL